MANSVNSNGTTGTSPLDQLDITKRQQADAKKRTTLGQDDFLKLMTTQLQNQDPMKPMDNGAFIGQMAQFSTVTGLQQMQKSIDDMSTAMISNQALQASALVGRYVLVPGNSGLLDGKPGSTLPAAVELPTSSSAVTVEVKDASGQTLKHLFLGTQQAGMVRFSWDGTDDNGNQMPAGKYNLEVSANVDGKMQAQSAFIAAPVQSVTLGKNGQGMSISVTGIGDITLDKVREII